MDSPRCLIRSEGPAAVTIGVHELVVIATQDSVLVGPRLDSQRVREAVAAIKARRRAGD
jgi:mannose-1-phosphate guanylyltransferase